LRPLGETTKVCVVAELPAGAVGLLLGAVVLPLQAARNNAPTTMKRPTLIRST
jgi:hypothetical protein